VREAGGGALAVGEDQVGGVALIEAVVQVPRTLRTRLRGTDRAGGALRCGKAACAECE
jgi:hypothetical protein